MQRIILCMMCVVMFARCGETAPQATTTPETTNETTTLPAAESKVSTGIPPQKVIYKACTMYAGSTDFFFEDENGKEMNVRMSNMPEDSMKFPDIMFEKGTEGPPDANPAMVGKAFLLLRDADSMVREIRLAQ